MTFKMRVWCYLFYLGFLAFTLLASVVSSLPVALIRERGIRENSYFYHTGNGFAYHFNVETGSAIYFKCALFEQGCRGRAILRLGGGFRQSKPHNHPADPNFVGLRHFRQNVLERSAGTRMSFEDIIEEARRDQRYARRVRSRMTLARLRTAMTRARTKNYPPVPHTLRELTQMLLTHNRVSQCVEGDDNMYAGSVTARDGSHHVAFFSKRMLQFMGQVTIIQGDGTFRARPFLPRSCQCFVFVTTWRSCVIPLGWVLMERKTYWAYFAVFQLLRQVCPTLNPREILCDWELAQQKAWQDVFPNSKLQGCLWHLSRAFVKKAKKLGILRYREALPDIVSFLRRGSAICLLPHQYFRAALNLLRNDARHQDVAVAYLLRPFFQYVEEFWIDHPFKRDWMQLFNVQHRTNNSCESHNKMLRKKVGAYRPNIYRFIEALAQMEHTATLDIDLMNEGEVAKRGRRWTSVFSDRQLTALGEDLEREVFHDEDITIRNFLSRASHLHHGAFNDHVEREAGRQ